MKRYMTIAAAIVCSIMISSCSATYPHCITAAPMGNKVGKSSRSVVLGFIKSNRNWGIAEAAKNGGIREGISVIDFKTSNYIFFMKQEFIVYGN